MQVIFLSQTVEWPAFSCLGSSLQNQYSLIPRYANMRNWPCASRTFNTAEQQLVRISQVHLKIRDLAHIFHFLWTRFSDKNALHFDNYAIGYKYKQIKHVAASEYQGYISIMHEDVYPNCNLSLSCSISIIIFNYIIY